MSKVCKLTGTRRMKRNKIAIERSKITKRTKGFANVNLQTRVFKTQEFGTVRIRIANRTMRTIEKYGGFLPFITNYKRNKLTDFAKKMRRSIYKTQNINDPENINDSKNINDPENINDTKE